MRKWAGFGKGTRHGRAKTNFAPTPEVMSLAKAAAQGEYKSKALIIAGRLLANDAERADGWYDFGAKLLIQKKARAIRLGA